MKIGFTSEPSIWVGVIKAVILCFIGFGLTITSEQFALVMVAIEAIASTIVRQNVVPNKTLSEAQINPNIMTMEKKE